MEDGFVFYLLLVYAVQCVASLSNMNPGYKTEYIKENMYYHTECVDSFLIDALQIYFKLWIYLPLSPV